MQFLLFVIALSLIFGYFLVPKMSHHKLYIISSIATASVVIISIITFFIFSEAVEHWRYILTGIVLSGLVPAAVATQVSTQKMNLRKLSIWHKYCCGFSIVFSAITIFGLFIVFKGIGQGLNDSKY